VATQEIASLLLLLDYVFGGLLVILTRLPYSWLGLSFIYLSMDYFPFVRDKLYFTACAKQYGTPI